MLISFYKKNAEMDHSFTYKLLQIQT